MFVANPIGCTFGCCYDLAESGSSAIDAHGLDGAPLGGCQRCTSLERLSKTMLTAVVLMETKCFGICTLCTCMIFKTQSGMAEKHECPGCAPGMLECPKPCQRF